MAPALANPARSSQLITTGNSPAESSRLLAHCCQCQVHVSRTKLKTPDTLSCGDGFPFVCFVTISVLIKMYVALHAQYLGITLKCCFHICLTTQGKIFTLLQWLLPYMVVESLLYQSEYSGGQFVIIWLLNIENQQLHKSFMKFNKPVMC